jgi:hypothetical protein
MKVINEATTVTKLIDLDYFLPQNDVTKLILYK